MAITNLSALPTELIHLITSSLSFPDVLSLRLATRSLSAKTSSDRRFEQRFATRTSDLSTKSLKTLAAIAAHPTFGALVREVTLVTSFLDTTTLRSTIYTRKKPPADSPVRVPFSDWDEVGPEELAAARRMLRVYEALQTDRARASAEGQDLALLVAVFERLGALETLKLEASVFKSHGEPRGEEQRLHVLRAFNYLPTPSMLLPSSSSSAAASNNAGGEERNGRPQLRHGEASGRQQNRRKKTQRRQIWEMASHDFSITLRAMAQSGIAINNMLVFGKEWGCSILSAEVGALLAGRAMFEAEGIRAAMSRLKYLSISVTQGSLQMFGGDLERTTVEQDGIVGNEILEGFADLLATCSSLEELDMRNVWMCNDLGLKRNCTDPRFFGDIATKAVVPKLRSLTLRGWTVRAEDVLHLLRKCNDLEELELREVRLWDGQWSQVFRMLGERTRQLKQVTLYRCFEKQLIRITRPVGAVIKSDSLGNRFTETFRLSGEEVRDGVDYCKQAERWSGRWPHTLYRRERMNEYGF
ncbi:hypothetical protein BFW01_g3586 [Lasiodiplodia theobromae]|uniref:F-box domain-containing protein n=1 Tax=Lasiodiplodia theobromae TaxID=45133 RepID=A0A5N5D5N8_9PEZI|nr:F-box domain cyclin-containing protein [Lasiodiplodia theobromae]KAB2572762.1 hypothetical protein DBV05_g8554 [Lasiodiplodia theobromae]KAF4541316.1 F-box domain cyclin-containing protein [Lasiodiplodia theobromae]KAF9632723.1 hypothetical protein BFW01_g3586 [Lasiodiplodia theobromae]